MRIALLGMLIIVAGCQGSKGDAGATGATGPSGSSGIVYISTTYCSFDDTVNSILAEQWTYTASNNSVMVINSITTGGNSYTSPGFYSSASSTYNEFSGGGFLWQFTAAKATNKTNNNVYTLTCN